MAIHSWSDESLISLELLRSSAIASIHNTAASWSHQIHCDSGGISDRVTLSWRVKLWEFAKSIKRPISGPATGYSLLDTVDAQPACDDGPYPQYL